MASVKYDSRYCFITGVIRAMEARRLSGEIIDRLLDSETPGLALDYIRNTLYASFQARTEDSVSLSSFLQNTREGLYRFVDEYSFHEGLTPMFRLGYDYHNIKTLIKGRIFEVPVREVVHGSGTLSTGEITGLFEREEYEMLPYTMGNAVEQAVEDYYITKNPFIIDVTVDRFLHADLLNRARTLDSLFIEGYIRFSIDLLNFRILYRAGIYMQDAVMRERLFISGGVIDAAEFALLSDAPPEESLLLAERHGYGRIATVIGQGDRGMYGIERECETGLIEFLGEARFLIWGVEALFAYAAMVERELSILGIIISGMGAGVSRAEIRQRLPRLI